MKTKYFFCSDLHGVHPKALLLALAEAGYEAVNPKHILVVAGDITDGHQEDNKLIECLRQKQKLEGAIIVKGNHDRGAFLDIKKIERNLKDVGHCFEGFNPEVDNVILPAITKENMDWIKSLPVQLETEHFYLAHGMYIKDHVIPGRRNRMVMSTWASPVLLGWHPKTFYAIGANGAWCGRYLNLWYPTITDYENSLEKDLYVGHFTQEAVKIHIRLNPTGQVAFRKDKHFSTFGKITFLDCDTKATGIVRILVKEY